MASSAKRRQGRLTPSQARAARRGRRNRRRRITRVTAFIAVGSIAFLFIISLFAGSIPISFGGSGPTGPGERVPLPDGYEVDTPHVRPGAEHGEYNSNPPSSGWHYGQTARWGVHPVPIDDHHLVHNLEHAGVIIQYDCPDGCDDLVENLTRVVAETDKVILAPRAEMAWYRKPPEVDTPTPRISLTAWGFIDQFNDFDEARVMAFIEAHVSSPNAPEPFAR